MSFSRLLLALVAVSSCLFLILGSADEVWAQPGSSTPITYEGELFAWQTETGSVNSNTGQTWDFWLAEVRAGTPVEITVVETSFMNTDLFVYQGAGEFPSGSTVSVLGPVLGQSTNFGVNPRTVMFTPTFSGPITIVVEDDDCCNDALYEISGTGIGGAGLVDLVAPNGFFELGQRLTLSVLLSDSSLSRNPGNVGRIAGVDFTLAFDPSLVTVDSITLGADVSTWLLSSNLTQLGEAQVALSSLDPVSAIFAQLELVNVHFRAVSTRGDVTIIIRDSNIFDDAPETIDHGAIAGVLIVGCDAGDVVKTGDVNTADTIKTLRFTTQLDVPSNEEFCAADINNDEVINTSDAVLNLQRVVGLTREPYKVIALPTAQIATVLGRTAVEIRFDAAAGVQSELRYDPRVLEFRGVTNLEGGLTSVNGSQPGRVIFAAVAPSPRDGSMRISFARIAPGTTQVSLSSLQAFDVDGIAYDQDGRSAIEFADEPDDPVKPRLPEIGIVRAGPNPFNPRIEFGVRVGDAGHAQLEIYDVKGRRVRTLELNVGGGGEYTVVWDGTDERGQRLASGVYNVRMITDSVVDRTRIMLLK